MPTSGQHRPGVTAAGALGPMLARQAAALRKAEARLGTGAGAVHDYRIAARRLRSVVAGYQPLFDVEPARRLREDLRQVGGVLGDARDAQVLREHVDRLVADLPASVDPGVAARARWQVDAVVEPVGDSPSTYGFLASAAYDDFTRRLDRFCDLPPWSPSASDPVEEALRPLLREEWKRFRGRARRSVEALHDDEALHDTRKAAKRAHYVFESAGFVFGRRAERVAKAAHRVQRALGDHRDQALASAVLGRALAEAERRGEVPTARLLRSWADASTAEPPHELPRLVAEADAKSLRKWLR